MNTYRICWLDSAGRGRFSDIKAEEVVFAVWQVAAMEGDQAKLVSADWLHMEE